MIELFGLLAGGIFRIIPEVLKFFTVAKEQKHELAMTELQLRIDAARSQLRIDEVHAGANAAEQAQWASALQDAIKAQATPSGVTWIDGLSASVRPILTYWHCLILYTAYKLAMGYMALDAGVSVSNAIVQGFTQFDQMMVGSMVSFWFVDRAIRHQQK
jgi:hypothetical protein